MHVLVVLLCILGLVSNARPRGKHRALRKRRSACSRDRFTPGTFAKRAFTTTAYIPSGSGPFPVVIFSPGFFQKGIAYAPYAKRLGSWGIIALLRDDPNFFAELSRQ